MTIAALTLLEGIWMEDEGCALVARFWHQVRLAIEVRTVADLQTALDAARGLRDLAQRSHRLDDDLEVVAVKVEQRAWERERRRLGIR